METQTAAAAAAATEAAVRRRQPQMEEPVGMVVVRGQEGLDAVNRLATLCLARLGERNT
jgi:hypothetical protein